MQKISIETCKKKKKKQKENKKEIDIETWQKTKEQAERVPKKLSGFKVLLFCIE